MPENQISANCMYIEIIQTFEIEMIITDTKWISETYRTFNYSVKLEARKIRLRENKKGESLDLDSPC